ncbi:hypothetical protein TYRP_011614 [Tyrophagus putrescentiae]|nr:hypothetical protein TYRP_011614 [Tyrophagus putrescentiae]
MLPNLQPHSWPFRHTEEQLRSLVQAPPSGLTVGLQPLKVGVAGALIAQVALNILAKVLPAHCSALLGRCGGVAEDLLTFGSTSSCDRVAQVTLAPPVDAHTVSAPSSHIRLYHNSVLTLK